MFETVHILYQRTLFNSNFLTLHITTPIL